MSTATETADIICQQITPGVLMSLGAHNLCSYAPETGLFGLVFQARVFPFNVNGDRSERPRIMTISVTVTPADLYDIHVTYKGRGRIVTHYSAKGIHADQLPAVLLSVDSDDDLQHAHIGHENRVTG